jgi:plasmid maintenance system antidote protein VapI
VRKITAETALLLEAALGVEAEFWIRAQFVWDCYRLREVERRTAVLEHEGRRPSGRNPDARIVTPGS